MSRVIFYKDGLNIFKEKWFLGAGGGAWNYLYRQYQSYNYASSQAHNYPLQLGIETGILGIFILFGLVILLIATYSKYYRQANNYPTMVQVKVSNPTIGLILSATVITSIAALFMHSVIDFDFSESSMLLLFWQLIALFNRELIDNLVITDLNFLNTKVNPKREKYTIKKKRKSTILIGIGISVVTLYFSSTFFLASSFAKLSFESLQNNDFDTAINKMEKAISLDRYNEKYVLGYNPVPNRPDIKVGLTDILFMKNEVYKRAQENGENISETELSLFQKQFSKVAFYIKNIERNAKNNLSLTSDLASYCFKTGDIDEGIKYLDSAINYFPFEPTLWHSKVDVYFQLMGTSFNNGDYEKANEYLLKGLNVINEAKDVNKKNMNPFVFSQNSVELLHKMKFLKDNWNNEEIHDVNEVIHYSMFDLDTNMDGIPDQWRISNTELLKTTINEEYLSIQASGRAYLYTRYPIKFKKGNTYRVEVQLQNPVEYISYHIPGVSPKVLPLTLEDGKYVAELVVENDPSENGNQLRIYIEDDFLIKNISVKELNTNNK
ncbi:MAG: O-antigen ligase family protein [Tissierellia bacterium]|nr:O-antigen ligase family protein [Tissierellia bacterium]